MKSLIQTILSLIAALISTTDAHTAGAEEVVYAQVGETVTIKTPRVNFSYKYVYWKFGIADGAPLQLAWYNHLGGKGTSDVIHWKNLAVSSESLTINSIQQENFGTILCEMSSNSQDTITTATKLLKLYVTMNPPSPLLPEESLSLACDTETPQGLKKPMIHWLNPQEEKISNRQVSMRVTSQHNGQWTCVVKADDKEKKAKISVTVIDFAPPLLHTQYTSESARLRIPCSIPSHISWKQIKEKGVQEVLWNFFPKPSSGLTSAQPQRLYFLPLQEPLSWNKDQHRDLNPESQDPKSGILTLTRKKGREGDQGDYVCIMKLKNGHNLSRTVHVNVLQIIPSPGTDLISGQPLNLTCDLGQPLPSDMRLQWSLPKQSSLSSLDSNPHPAHLTIPRVGTGDGGDWGCSLWQGKKQLTSAVIKLRIEPRLSVWMLVIICSAAVIVILLLILVFILCRRRQRNTRHFRQRLCQCKNPKPKGFYRT